VPSALAAEVVAPAHYTRPKFVTTDGPLVAEICELAGFAPDPEQRMLLDDLFAVGRDGKSASFEFGVVACRQNLKTGLFKQAALGWLFVTDQRLSVWSAHEFRTSQEAFREMDELCAAHPELSKRVKNVYRGNGDESIEMKTGQRLIFKARTKGGGRGLSGDKVILDEAFALRAMHMGALLPTLSARPDPQVLYGSSAGMADSSVLHELRKRGIDGSPRLTYAEWGDIVPASCASDECDHHWTREGCCLDDEARWQRGNPAMGRRITVDYIRSERRALPPEEFARERLGWWDEPATDAKGIDRDAWAALADPDAEPTGTLRLAIDAAPRLASASIVVVGGGVAELVDRRAGTNWLISRVAGVLDRNPAIDRKVGYDPNGPVAALVPEFEFAGIELEPIEGKDSVRATGALLRAVDDRLFRHRGEAEFDAAVIGARLRDVGDGQKWSRKDSTVDITPLVALTVAMWLAGLLDPDEDYDLMDSFL
jgi:hypothetical protein